METIEFKKMEYEDSKEIMDIYNYYAENSFAAYPETKLPKEAFSRFMEMTKNYPAYTIKVDDKTAGFCLIRAYNPFPAFKETAEITYFISREFTGRGLGKAALEKLQNDAKNIGIKNILASITSENAQSLNFHKKNGFEEWGRFPEIATKFGKKFGIVWMGKKI